MTDITFLIIALAVVALVMVPVIAEGIHHTEFKKREPLIRVILAFGEMTRAVQTMSTVLITITANFEQFARALQAADQKRGR